MEIKVGDKLQDAMKATALSHIESGEFNLGLALVAAGIKIENKEYREAFSILSKYAEFAAKSVGRE